MQDSLKGACNACFYSHINVLECNRGAMKVTQLKIIIICLIQDLLQSEFIHCLKQVIVDLNLGQLFFFSLMSAPS